jgi:hypothetical protein
VDLVYSILHLAGFDESAALEEFGPYVHLGTQINGEDFSRPGIGNDLAIKINWKHESRNVLLWLGLWLITRKPCAFQKEMSACESYRAIKQILVLLQSTAAYDIDALHMGILVLMFEFGHGLQRQAFYTLASCVASLRYLLLRTHWKQEDKKLDMVKSLGRSLIMLDRYVS